MENEQKTYIPFKELPEDLKNRFIIRAIILVLLLFIDLVFMVWTKLVFAFSVFLIPLGIDVILQTITLVKIMHNKYKYYEGICIRVKQPDVAIGNVSRPLIKINGYSSATLLMAKDLQVEIPISNGFDLSDGDTVAFYAAEENFFPKTEVLYQIENPLCVKVVKRKSEYEYQE